MKRLFLPVILLLSFHPCLSQEIPIAKDTIRKDALNVFIQSSDYFFDESTDHIHREIPYVNYVRDIKDAGVYIIPTRQRTGSGGYENTCFLVGQNEYAGMRDTLIFVTTPDETTEGYRHKLVSTLKMGLMRYVAKTPLAQYLNISFSQPLSETVSSDKWNSWVYSASFNAYSSGQSTYNFGYLYGELSANRITEKSKFESSFGMDFQSDRTTYQDTIYKSTINDKYGYLSYVKSINNHWSAGGLAYVQSSTYSNYDLSVRIAPGIEYDVFPYSESTRRILTFLYQAGVEINNYTDETLRFKYKETVGYHSLAASISLIQKWGSVTGTLTWHNYMFDWSYYRLRFNTSASIRIFKGFSFNISGSVASVHDQISLPRGEASLEDVLLRRKMQATEYQYYTSFGFSYTFGSIYNNVVNPRFGRALY
jgi:hypothetical protein